MSNFLEQLDDDDQDDNRFLCPICSTEDVKELTTLKCGHKFCRRCIIKWYIKLNILIFSSSNYVMMRECPVCRQNGGYLELLDNEKFIQGIHKEPNIVNKKELYKCNAPIKSRPGKCCNNSGHMIYGGYCGKHKKIFQMKFS